MYVCIVKKIAKAQQRTNSANNPSIQADQSHWPGRQTFTCSVWKKSVPTITKSLPVCLTATSTFNKQRNGQN